ncbi:MAG TPA: winged helix-turn-helix domain-containing protein, partial [Streptosporangiaceae bacterium]
MQVDVGVAGAVRVPALGAPALLAVMDLFSATLLTVRVGILGPLEVRDDTGTLLPIGGTRLRALLIRLAIADGRAISVERLAEELWDGQRPADAANAVQALVSRLRGAVGRDTVEFGPAGYRLVVDQDAVDARVFEQ